MQIDDRVWVLWKYKLQRMGIIKEINGDDITVYVSIINYNDTKVIINKSKILRNYGRLVDE